MDGSVDTENGRDHEDGEDQSGADTESDVEVMEPRAPAPAVPSIKELMHLNAIRQRLAPEEWQLCEQVVRDMEPEDRYAWRDELLALSADDAVAKIRAAMTGGDS